MCLPDMYDFSKFTDFTQDIAKMIFLFIGQISKHISEYITINTIFR